MISRTVLVEHAHNRLLRARQMHALITSERFAKYIKTAKQDMLIKILDAIKVVDHDEVMRLVSSDDLDNMSRTRLREIASQLQIPLYSRMLREELISEIRDVRKERDRNSNKGVGTGLPTESDNCKDQSAIQP